MTSTSTCNTSEIQSLIEFSSSEKSFWIFVSLVKEKVKNTLMSSNEEVFIFGLSKFRKTVKDSVAGILDVNTDNFYSFEKLPIEVVGKIEEYDKHIVKISILGAPVFYTLEDGTFHLMNIT